MGLGEQIDQLAPDRLACGCRLGLLAERRGQSVVESHLPVAPWSPSNSACDAAETGRIIARYKVGQLREAATLL